MAAISQILGYKWPGAQWWMEGDAYAGLTWLDASPKPTEAEISAFSTEVDGLIDADQKAERQRGLLDKADAILQSLEVLGDAVADIQAKARVTSPLTTSNLNKIITLVDKLAQIRSQ